MVEEKTQTSRILYSIKNHKICSIVIVLCTGIVAASTFLKSTYDLVETTGKIKERVVAGTDSSGGKRAETLRAEEFSACFGGTTVEQISSGGVILTRTESGKAGGCEFHKNGGNIPLDAEHSRIELQPVRAINSGYYVVSITFKNEAGGRWAEKDWLRDTGRQDTSLQVLPDVREFASVNGITGMTEYFIKLRIQPWKFDGPDPAFVFSRLSILPVR